MSRRRLDKLEGSLMPKESVLHWLGEAHAFGSLPAYVGSLIDQPDAAQPFVALPVQVAKAIYESMRRERSGSIKKATREAVGDTVFLLQLVIDLNVHNEQILRIEGLRHAALVWWSRALDSAEEPEDDAKPDGWSDWRRGVSALRGTLSGIEQTRAAAEARYLDGHECLFPELALGWRELCTAAEMLTDDGRGPDDELAGKQASVRLQWVVLMARTDGLEASGQTADADALAQRVVTARGGQE